MPVLSQFILPVKDPTTGVITNQTFDIGGPGYTELVTTIAANATTATFTNAAITDSATYDIYTSEKTVLKSKSISGTTLTLIFKPVSVQNSIKIRIS